jgi:uncharacterized protein YgiB involved in biofilm formation
MKRSKSISLKRYQHIERSAKILGAGMTATLLSGCDSPMNVEVVSSQLDCLDDTQMSVAQCDMAYQQALIESQQIGPKYDSDEQCESEFGRDQCERNSLGTFTPIMAGYLFANALWDRDSNRYAGSYNPVYRYFRPFSPLHNKLVTADGDIVGDYDDDDFKVKRKSLKKKKPVYKTLSRSGFGQTARTKSSFKGWGG